MLSLPWGKKSKVKKDIKLAEDILNDDHYGLEKVKERILEYLAVQQRAGKMKGPILCLVGPPGVGKTSLGKSIARGHGTRIRAHVAWRRARRGGNPRPPAHLYRLDARQDHPVDEEGEDRPIRCSCSTRSTSWAPTGAAIRLRRCWKCWTRSRTDLQRPLPGGRLRPFGRDVRHHGQHAAHAAAADGPHGDHPHPRLHRG